MYIIFIALKEAFIMLFSKNTEPHCSICVNSKKINENEAICPRHGIVSLNYKCRKFKYDATKRIPPEETLLPKDSFDESDFSLDR